jgi:hypothetical protein
MDFEDQFNDFCTLDNLDSVPISTVSYSASKENVSPDVRPATLLLILDEYAVNRTCPQNRFRHHQSGVATCGAVGPRACP